MKKSLFLFVLVLILFGCGGVGVGDLDVKLSGKQVPFTVRSSGSYNSVKTFTDANGKMTTATSFYAIMANYDMDTTSVASMKKPLTSAEQVRLTLQLIGAEGTDEKGQIKPGVYNADPSGKYMKVDSLTVATFADGKESTSNFETQFSTSKITGQVEVKSVTADSVSGTIDVTEGDRSVKGSFIAKVAAKK